VVLDTRNPAKVRAGRLGGLARWSQGPHIVRMGELHPAVQDAIRALIAADKEMKKPASEGQSPEAGTSEVGDAFPTAD
jgi:hypothetical protein